MLAEHEAELRPRFETHGVQTNEVQRCTMLLPTFLTASVETGLPVELLELGPSAGLNLLVDRYRYRYENGAWGAADALLGLTTRETPGGAVPASLLSQELVVRRDSATLRLDLPLAEKGRIQLKKIGLELVVRVDGHKRAILLPPALEDYRPTGATFRDGALDVTFAGPDSPAPSRG